jgi:chromosome partitioning protein
VYWGLILKKASIINFKGGVGKTTLSFHLACFLAKESRVLLIDVDHQSSLSVVMLRSLWEARVAASSTVNRIFESFCNRKVAMPGIEIIVKNALHAKDKRYDFYPNLDFVAAQFELDDTEIDLASTNYGNAVLSDWDKRTLLAHWLDSIDAHKNYDYVLFDCPPATKIVSQNALAASDCYIVPVIPDELSSRGVTHFQGLVKSKIDAKLQYLHTNARVDKDQTPKNFVPSTSMAAIVPFIVKQAGRAASGLTNIHTEQLAALRGMWKGAVISTVGLNYIGIPESVNAGWPVWNFAGNNATHDVQKMMTNICSELKARIDKS